MPYAKAMVENQATIDLCLPGGTRVLTALGKLLQQDPTPFLLNMENKAKLPTRVIIRESECIGCAKCIQACPVDAILGSSKNMHTVIADECTGCELCIPVCPVDCMDVISLSTEQNTQEMADHARQRYYARQTRLHQKKVGKRQLIEKSIAERKDYIRAALARAKAKKLGV